MLLFLFFFFVQYWGLNPEELFKFMIHFAERGRGPEREGLAQRHAAL